MKLLWWVAIGLLSERLRNNILNYPQKHICLKRMENHGCSPRLVVKVVCGEFLWSSLLKAHMLHCGFHMSQDRANHTYIICTLTMLNSFHGVELKSLSNPRENITSLSSPKLLAILVFGLEQINICGARMGFLFQHQGDALCTRLWEYHARWHVLHCLPWGLTRMLPTLIKRSLWSWWRTCSILFLATQLSNRRGFQCSMSCAHTTCVICSKSSKHGRANITYHIKSNISKIFRKAETTQQQHPRQYNAIWGKRWCNKDQEF